LARQGRLVSLEGAREDVLPFIDLYPAHESHTPGSQYVVIRNDGKRDSADVWVMAGDLIYQFENLNGGNDADPYYVPVGLGSGSQTNMLLAIDEMIKRAGGETRRVIPAHEEGLKNVFPSRIAKNGLRVTEIALADGEESRVK
jgi:glyoxylase-like metal-dependent hydrolase (beta-lactamase superfamily II)